MKKPLKITREDFNLGRMTDNAVYLASRRRDLYSRKPAIHCPMCMTHQVQLKDWISLEIRWKCRECKYEWVEIKAGKTK